MHSTFLNVTVIKSVFKCSIYRSFLFAGLRVARVVENFSLALTWASQGNPKSVHAQLASMPAFSNQNWLLHRSDFFTVQALLSRRILTNAGFHVNEQKIVNGQLGIWALIQALKFCYFVGLPLRAGQLRPGLSQIDRFLSIRPNEDQCECAGLMRSGEICHCTSSCEISEYYSIFLTFNNLLSFLC